MNDFRERLRRAGEAGPPLSPPLGGDLVARGRARRRHRRVAGGTAGLVLLAAVGVGAVQLRDGTQAAPVISNPSEAAPRVEASDASAAVSVAPPPSSSEGAEPATGTSAARAPGAKPASGPTDLPSEIPTDPTAQPSPTPSRPAGTDPGITDNEIVLRTVVRHGVVSSFTSVPAPAVEAYIAYANSELPAIHGRRLRLEVVNLDAVTDPADVYGPACDEVFALVGNLGDEAASAITAECGLPDVRARAHTRQQSLGSTTAAIHTALPADVSLDVWRAWADREPRAVERAAWVRVLERDGAHADQRRRSLDVQDATADLGYEWLIDFEAPEGSTRWYDEVAEQMRDAEIEFVHVDAWSPVEVTRLRDALRGVGHTPILLTAPGRLYDDIRGSDPVSELKGIEMAVDHILVGEVGLSDSSERFATWLDRVDPGAKPTVDGMYAWAATELLVQQLRSLGPDPTRAGLLRGLSAVRTFDAGEMLGARAVMGGAEATCHVLLRHDGTRLRRVDQRGAGYVDC